VFGIDPTIERRWGAKIAARGIYRDPVRSTDSHFVKTSDLRWIGLMGLTSISWVQRVWALPVMTVLAPSERYDHERQRSRKTRLERSLQMLKALRRFLPEDELVVVGDNGYAALDFLAAAQQLKVTVIARLRLDAALYEPAAPYNKRGRLRMEGRRLPTLAAILADPTTDWQQQTVAWYDGAQREMERVSGTAVWFDTGKTPVPIRWVLIRDPRGKYDPVALLCTDPAQEVLNIVEMIGDEAGFLVGEAQPFQHLGQVEGVIENAQFPLNQVLHHQRRPAPSRIAHCLGASLQPLAQAAALLLGQFLGSSAAPLRFQTGNPRDQQAFQPGVDTRHGYAMFVDYLARLVSPTVIQQRDDPLDHPTVTAFIGFGQRLQQFLDRFWTDPYSYLHDRWLSGGVGPSSLPTIHIFSYRFSNSFSEHL